MNKRQLLVLQIGLLATGAYAARHLSKSMFDDGMLNPEPNAFHLKRSPFGRTLALAMHGPVDVYWHRGAPHDHGQGEACDEDHEHGPDCNHGHACEEDHDHGPDCTHGPLCEEEHEHGPDCDHGPEALSFENDHEHPAEGHDHDLGDALTEEFQRLAGREPAPAEGTTTSATEETTLRQSLLQRIQGMRKAYYSRTNNNPDTRLHKAFIMDETQKRLKLSFEMDPTNIAGYGAYFLFLSEAIARVEKEAGEEQVIRHRQEAALHLAHYTVSYCLNFTDEAPAMMTAATAAHDYFQLHLSHPDPDLKLAGQFLRVIDQCTIQYEKIRHTMQADGRWARYPFHRSTEMENAYTMIRKLRDLDHERFAELTAQATQPVPPSGS